MKEKLRWVLTHREKRHIFAPGRISAAVLLPLYNKQGEYHILFIKRTERVSTHKGQISFPGGAFEAADGTLLNTALRESCEEVGVMPGKVEVLGELDDEVSLVSNYVITPFVGIIPYPYPFKVDGEETELTIEAPLSAFIGKSYEEQEVIAGESRTTYRFYYDGREIWGATARILYKFLKLYVQSLDC